jgi:tetratricopeptide (TPR) repeat protein
MLTGENAMDMVMGAIEYEPDDYITKPFTIDVMRQRLTRILSVKELIRPINESIDLQAKAKTIQLCDEFIKRYPRLELRVMRIKSRTLLNMKAYEEALNLFDVILNERKINWAMLGKATCLFHLEKYDAAKQLINLTIEQHPKYVQCYDLLSKINIKQKNSVAAQNALIRAIQVSPKQVLRQMELGRIALVNQDFEVAEGAFKQSVKLARHSCYRTVKNYLLFAKSLQHKITPKNNRSTRISSSEAFKALDEAKALYKDNPEYIYDATIIESTTFSNLGKEADAKTVANKAEAMLSKLSHPTCAQQLALADTFIDTQQHAKAQDLLAIINTRKDLSRSEQRNIEHTRNEINEHVVRSYTTEINDKAIEFFERGEFTQAIELFDKATAYKEAGLAVLLNAIQAKITYMDRSEVTSKMVDEVGEHFDIVGGIPESDERHIRWLTLQRSYERLKRSV